MPLTLHNVRIIVGYWNNQGDHSPDNVKFPDNSLAVCGTPAHVKCYSHHAGTCVIVSGGGRNATVHDPKPLSNAKAQQTQEWMQICS